MQLSDRQQRLTIDIPEAATLFGISRSLAYALAKRNAFPCPVLHLGRRVVVSREALRAALGLTDEALDRALAAQEGVEDHG